MSGDFVQIFPGQNDSEKYLFYFRRHPMRLYFDMIKMIVQIVALYFVIYFLWLYHHQALVHTFAGQVIGLFIIGYVNYVVFRFHFRVLEYFLRIYVVTNERIVEFKSNFFTIRDTENLAIMEIQDMQVICQGFLRNFFHFGNIRVILTATNSDKVFHDVPHPHTLMSRLIKIKSESKAAARIVMTIPETEKKI